MTSSTQGKETLHKPTPTFSRIIATRTGNFNWLNPRDKGICYDFAWSQRARDLYGDGLPTGLVFSEDSDPGVSFSDLEDVDEYQDGLAILFREYRSRVIMSGDLPKISVAENYLDEHWAEEDLLRAQYAVDLAKWQQHEATEALEKAERRLEYAQEKLTEKSAECSCPS